MKKSSLSILLIVALILSFGMSSFAGSPSPNLTMTNQTNGSTSNDMSKYVGSTLDNFLRDLPGQTLKVEVHETLGAEGQINKSVSFDVQANEDVPKIGWYPYFGDINCTREEMELLASTDAPEAYIYIYYIKVNSPGYKVCGLEVGDSASEIDLKMKELGMNLIRYNPGNISGLLAALGAVGSPFYCYQNDYYTLEIQTNTSNRIHSLRIESTPYIKIKETLGLAGKVYPFPHYDTPPQPIQGVTREVEYKPYEPTSFDFQVAS